MFCGADVVKQSEHQPLLFSQHSASPAEIKQQNVCPNRGKRTAADAEVNAALERMQPSVGVDEAEQAVYNAKRGLLHLKKRHGLPHHQLN